MSSSRPENLILSESFDAAIQLGRIRKVERSVGRGDLVGYRSYFRGALKYALLFYQTCLSNSMNNRHNPYNNFEDFDSQEQSAHQSVDNVRTNSTLDKAEAGLSRVCRLTEFFDRANFHDPIPNAYLTYLRAARQLLQDYIWCSKCHRLIEEKGQATAIQMLDEKIYRQQSEAKKDLTESEWDTVLPIQEAHQRETEDKRNPTEKSLDRHRHMHHPFLRLSSLFADFETTDEDLKKHFMQLFAFATVLTRLGQRMFDDGPGGFWSVNLHVFPDDFFADVACQISDDTSLLERSEDMVVEITSDTLWIRDQELQQPSIDLTML